jgi:sugar phosphate permease
MEIKGKSLGYRIQQFLIFVIHIVLLWWIYWLLQNTGNMTTNTVFIHFTGIGIYGALLIRGCAAWAKHHHLKEISKHNSDE